MESELEALFGYVSPITLLFETFCRGKGIKILNEEIDKHGSLAWEGVRQDELSRFLTLSLTPLPSAHPADPTQEVERPVRWRSERYTLPRLAYPCRIEIQAGADNGAQFRNLAPVGFDLRTARDASALFPEELFARLAAVWQEVLSLSEADLTESFLVSRGRERSSG